jgi:hypothetical protein
LKIKISSLLLFLFGTMSSLTKKWIDVYDCWGRAWSGTTIYCSQFCTCIRYIATRSKFLSSGMSVICAVVTANPQANKCILIFFVNLCMVYFHLHIIFKLISSDKIFILVSLKFIWHISNYYAKNWTSEFNGTTTAGYWIIFILESPYMSHNLNQPYNYSASDFLNTFIGTPYWQAVSRRQLRELTVNLLAPEFYT